MTTHEICHTYRTGMLTERHCICGYHAYAREEMDRHIGTGADDRRPGDVARKCVHVAPNGFRAAAEAMYDYRGGRDGRYGGIWGAHDVLEVALEELPRAEYDRVIGL